MMHVAPMPERPPFKNGLTAFQVALSRRDMAGGRWKIAYESGRRFEGFEGQILTKVPENVPILVKLKRERAHMGNFDMWKRKTV